MLEQLEKQIEKLSQKEQLTLLEKLARQIRISSSVTEKKMDWNELYGLGEGVWQGQDAQTYVNKLREERL